MTLNSIGGITKDTADTTERMPTEQEIALITDFTEETGVAAKLTKRIGKVSIDHPVIIRAFEDFLAKSGSDMESFRLMDLLSFNESVKKGGFVYGNVGDLILCMSRIPSNKKLAKEIYTSSVNGLYELIDRTNGIALDLTKYPDENMSTLAEKRFIFANKKRADKIISAASLSGIAVLVMGVVLSEKRVVIVRDGIPEIDIDKRLLYPWDDSERIDVGISDGMYADYLRGFSSVFCYKYGFTVGFSTPVMLGTVMDISRLLAVLLGIFSASKVLTMGSVKLLLVSGEDITIRPARGNIMSGDKLYLLSPNCNNEGIPFVDSYNSIIYYLSNLGMRGILRAACPINGYLNPEIEKLLGSEYELEKHVSYDTVKRVACSILLVSCDNIEGRLLGTIRNKEESLRYDDTSVSN